MKATNIQLTLKKPPSLKMGAVTNTIIRLSDLFYKINGNFAVRGSFSRGDADFNDVDVAIYLAEGERISDDGLPKTFLGRNIGYWSIPIKDAERYYEHCIRPSISLVETKFLKLRDKDVGQMIERQQQKFYLFRRMQFLLYILIDEDTMLNLYSFLLKEDSYSMLKRQAGSKKTISRVVWATKALFPETRELNSIQTLEFLCTRRIMSEKTKDTCLRILENLQARHIEKVRWANDTNQIDRWFQQEFKSLVLSRLEGHLDPILVKHSLSAANQDATQEEIDRAFKFARKLPLGPEKFILYFALSGNTRTRGTDLVAIFDEIKGDFVYNNITRNLIMNPHFPERLLSPDLVNASSLSKRAYEIRKKLLAHPE
ncbi:hypothetical protein A2276_06865 [candidate division WOR-1 bacterium RIFOXYA12_FULL_43_27]|uniref:Uncharacterized protein n=1 Tax=candidate division WOR-1 bacterium RIFOXYC2_FULL_46_14 TaxID=1802587 RepID=A0A1F4U5H9_UNCSA|nr:MAG: hypothetical protein A2276_06865 [candidate division WOR-1 bacterium RIFOXYA12_FULL_43_27]OGC20368.1 MAG: hypothetical protein A2292_04865 [candidate division WOR-1 bacterium RIFOXYB2_FULL_46_45]OGC31895.1 MAG: hypothetical protein A2232_06585 [candidate division WOR-1 bacterium RIFOXYA2_FULL_46_56]OGC40214.1 MAG: hypothetical protein A2438_02885 [candidate division WOR-1 bacterium RIFOXYC2_FULL_46_14]